MRAVKILQQSLAALLVTIHTTRAAAVFWAVRSLLLGGRLSLTALGRSAAGRSLPKHAIKRADRLLGNKKLHRQMPSFFKAIATLLIAGRSRPVILVDWTPLEDEHVALVAALPLDGRSIPVYLEVHPKKKDNNLGVMKRFLRKLHTVLPYNCRPIIVTDAGFRNDWFTEVVVWGWDFVGRVRNNPFVRDLVNPKWFPLKTLYKHGTKVAQDLGRWVIAQSNPRVLRFVIIHKRIKKTRSELRGPTAKRKAMKRAWEPWLLATSLDNASAKKVVDIYAKRMQIEETFRDTKNHRFGWSFEDARSKSSERLEVLLLVASLGMLAVTLVGQAAESRGFHRQYQANTIRKRRVLSLFFLGCNLIRRQDDSRIGTTDLRESLNRIRSKLLCVDDRIVSYFVGIP